MTKYYSSGELAKMCKITIRTVQYYDKEDLLKPSKLSEGGRRQYTEEDYIKLKSICLYRSLGLSIDKIKEVMQTCTTESIEYLITLESKKLDEKMYELEDKKEKLSIILEQIKQEGKLGIESIDDLEQLIQKKKTYHKNNVKTVITLVCFVVFMFFGYKIAAIIGGNAPSIIIGISVIYLLALIYWHKEVNAYICPKCTHKFTINFIKDMISPNGFRGKYLKCPNCSKRSWCKETYPD